MTKTTICVEKETQIILMQIKQTHGFSTIDAVINVLIKNSKRQGLIK